MPGAVAIILAGGANRRFWPLTQKSLLRFGDQTLLERHVGVLADAGFADVVIVANPDNEPTIREIAGTRGHVHVVVQPEARGMGDALLCAESAIVELGDEPIMVSQVHDLVDPALFRTLLADLDRGDADGLVVGVRMPRYFPGGYLTIRDGHAVDVVEKPPPGREPSDLVKIVADVVRRPAELFDALRGVEPRPDDQYEQALARLMGTRRIGVVDYEGAWVAIKYPWDVLRAVELLLARLSPTVQTPADAVIHKQATVVGPVLLGAGVRVLAGAAIVGPAIVGADTIVGSGALVRGSVVGRGCIVGFATEIARSYVGDGCEFHTNYVGDSVIGDDVSFGSGTVTGNLRLDERTIRVDVDGTRIDTGMPKLGVMVGSRVRAGINVSFGQPGLRVGSSSAIGPGILLMHDLGDHRLILAHQEQEIRANPIQIDGASRAAFRAALRK